MNRQRGSSNRGEGRNSQQQHQNPRRSLFGRPTRNRQDLEDDIGEPAHIERLRQMNNRATGASSTQPVSINNINRPPAQTIRAQSHEIQTEPIMQRQSSGGDAPPNAPVRSRPGQQRSPRRPATGNQMSSPNSQYNTSGTARRSTTTGNFAGSSQLASSYPTSKARRTVTSDRNQSPYANLQPKEVYEPREKAASTTAAAGRHVASARNESPYSHLLHDEAAMTGENGRPRNYRHATVPPKSFATDAATDQRTQSAPTLTNRNHQDDVSVPIGDLMPDGWSCSEHNDAGINCIERAHLSKNNNRSAMVVASKPIPMDRLKELERIKNTAKVSGTSLNRLVSGHDSESSGGALFPEDVENTNMMQRQSSSASKLMTYYFEVTLKEGTSIWIGLVPEDKAVRSSSSSKYPYKVVLDQLPGSIPGSIGLSSNGVLLLGSSFLDGWAGDFGTFRKNDTLGCGIEVLGQRRVFFTKNGKPVGDQKTEMSVRTELCLPAVALVEGNVDVVANFGFDPSQPFRWRGDERRTVAVPERPQVSPQMNRRPRPSPQISNDSRYDSDDVRSGMYYQSAPRVQESYKQPGVHFEQGPPPAKSEGSYGQDFMMLSPQEVNEFKSWASELSRLCEQDSDNTTRIDELVKKCEKKQQDIPKTVDNLFSLGAQEQELNAAIDLGESLSKSVSRGKDFLKQNGDRKPSARTNAQSNSHYPLPGDEIAARRMQQRSRPGVLKTPTFKERENDSEVLSLVEKKDVFQLICLLRANNHDKRLDAALALMRFAEGLDNLNDFENQNIRKEIQSCGGMTSFLSVFSADNSPQELKVVVAMAVAYLSPSFNTSNKVDSITSMKILECLRYLASPHQVSVRAASVSENDMYDAATAAAQDFWLNAIVPSLDQLERIGAEGNLLDGDKVPKSSRRRRLKVASAAGSADEHIEAIELQKLMERAVSLIAQLFQDREKDTNASSSQFSLIEHVCGVKLARPVAVQEGLLNVIISWLKSNNEQRILPAATALGHLTSTQDKYLAGWIHSQVVNENALREIVPLLETGSTYNLRLAVTKILASLSRAPNTRAALVRANSTRYLTMLIYGDLEQDIVLVAAQTLLQLIAGEIFRPSANRDKLEDRNEALDETGKVDVIQDIIQTGALHKFISMAKLNRGELRSTSIEAVRVLSEDSHSSRDTILDLCQNDASRVLGEVVNEDVEDFCRDMKPAPSTNRSFLLPNDRWGYLPELFNAICALANIFEPTIGKKLGMNNSQHEDPRQHHLLDGCIQTAESGGLRSLQKIALVASAAFAAGQIDGAKENDILDVLFEVCRSLASLSSLLVSERVAEKGFAGLACDLLQTLMRVLNCSMSDDDSQSEVAVELQFDALRGIGCLAASEPLKLILIDECLPFLLKAKDSRGAYREVSNAANQVCISLGFAEDEKAVQVAGSDAKLLGDWFCLQRSFVVQSMAREEIRRIVSSVWNGPIQDLQAKDILPAKLGRDSSGSTANSSVHITEEKSREATGDETHTDAYFGGLEEDEDTSEIRTAVLKEYEDMFEHGPVKTSQPTDIGFLGDKSTTGLLSKYVYPMNSVATEKTWILEHGKTMKKWSTGDAQYDPSSTPLDNRVQKLLDCCFPSRLLQEQILPVTNISPESSFNFRALLMPQRKYFSFRREGQLVSRLCDKHAASANSEDVHWTLGFTNSTFAGEFTETLVQSLYRCPIVQGLSFASESDRQLGSAKANEHDDDDGFETLADLSGCLPPWIWSLTFDGVLTKPFVEKLVEVLEMMGKLSAGEGQKHRESIDALKDHGSQLSKDGNEQGTFRCLALRNSPWLGAECFLPFFGLLRTPDGVHKPHLSGLRSLDLSGNNLGDTACARLLDYIHKPESLCFVEELDISDNNIREGNMVYGILNKYRKRHRASGQRSWCAPLKQLKMASNFLCDGSLGRNLLIELLKKDALALTSLDLSGNDLRMDQYEDPYLFCGSLNKNTTLRQLDLSKNKFSSNFLDTVLSRLHHSESHAAVPFLCLNENDPPLSPRQRSSLEQYSTKARSLSLERFIKEKELLRKQKEPSEQELPPISEKRPRRQSLALSVVEEGSLMSHESSLETNNLPRRDSRGSSHVNLLTVLYSAPLVYQDEQGLKPFLKLEFEMERELIWQCLKEAKRDINLSFDNATSDRLVATVGKGCECLHYSGHGHEHYLPLEDKRGNGATHWLQVQELGELISSGVREGGAPFKMVFVSACHSFLAGETFARAGVPHVVCCQQDSELKDAAALAFTRQFYLALAEGRTVKQSFDQGCNAVRYTPNIKNPTDEMRKFLLLPKKGDHNKPVFNARRLLEWPKSNSLLSAGSQSRRGRGLARARSVNIGGARNSELSVRNMMQEDPSPTPPQFFLGREVDLHKVLSQILTRRLVSVISPAGYGSSSFACALCHYINERRNTITGIEKIFFVKAKKSMKGDRRVSVIWPLVKKLQDHGRLTEVDSQEDLDPLLERIVRDLKSKKALVVFDGIELLEGSEEDGYFKRFLNDLFAEAPKVKVLLTGRKRLGIPSYGGVMDYSVSLGPLNYENTVRLFALLCPHLHTLREREKLYVALVTDADQAALLPDDPQVWKRTRKVFESLGNGVPTDIEKAAYSMMKDDLEKLRNLSED